MSERAPRILVVDDVRENVRLLEAVLAPRGYDVMTAYDGAAALEIVEQTQPDLVLLDVVMPGLDGYAVCRALRESDETAVLPVIMVTSSLGEEKTRAIAAGADDFIPKPFNHDEMLARVRSLLRIKRYHDTIKEQARELEELKRSLEWRVQEQVAERSSLDRLRRFLSPQVVEAVVSVAGDAIFQSHRREVATVSAALPGWSSLVDIVEPEELMRMLLAFHAVIGRLVPRFDASVGFLVCDRVQLFFNDPIAVADGPLRAVRLGCALREEMAELSQTCRSRGYDLDFGAGIAVGYATCGDVGFEGRSDYAAIGAVTNIAAGLADEASNRRILISQRVYAEVEDAVEAEPAGEFPIKGLRRPVAAFNVLALRA